MGILELTMNRENWLVFGLKELLIGDRLVKLGQSSTDPISNALAGQVRSSAKMKYDKQFSTGEGWKAHKSQGMGGRTLIVA